MQSKLYAYDKPTRSWRRKGGTPIYIDPSPPDPVGPGDNLYQPISYSSVGEARTALGAPSDANYVVWDNSWTHLEQAFLALGANDILVLPEREEPYWIDSSNGFMASGVKEVDGTGMDGRKDGSRVPIVSNPRLWFAMCRARRGVMGLGLGAVIMPSDSGFSAPRWPTLEDEPDNTMLRYMLDGTSTAMVGASSKLIEVDHDRPFFANFTIKGRDFGALQYTGIASDNNTHTTVKRVLFDGCWRSDAGVPNGETGGLGMLRGTYLIENCEFISQSGSSPVMWNRNQGGVVRHVKSSRPNMGMWTFWRSGGLNVFEDVWLDGGKIGINLEENLAGFELRWTGGKMTLDHPTNKFHFGINPSGGSNKITLTDVMISPNGYTPNRTCFNVYTTSGVQKRSDVSCNTLPPEHLPGSSWIN